MDPIKAMIIDDELRACNMLKVLIQKHIPAIQEIQLCNSAQQALQLLEKYRPNLVFLDIEMPNMNGFDLLNALGNWDFDVIFTTAFDKYAIKAIRFSALDYLLKPIDAGELKTAVQNHVIKKTTFLAQQQLLVNNLLMNLRQLDNKHFRLALSTSDGVYFFHPKDIIRCEAESNYTRFYFTQQKPMLVSKTMKEYEEILSEYNFIRAHKSHLVNSSFVTHIDKEGLLWFADGSYIPTSRRRRDGLLKYFL